MSQTPDFSSWRGGSIRDVVRRSRAFATRCGLLALVVALVLLGSIGTAWAHQIGLSTGEYRAHGSTLVAKMAFARNELALLAPSIDRNRDGHITASEVADAKALLTEKILRRIHVSQAAAECAPALDDAGLTEQDGILVGAHWSCGASDQAMIVRLDVLDDLARGHRHVARAVFGEETADAVLFGADRTFEVPAVAAGAGDAGGPSSTHTPATGASPGFGALFLMGIEHILMGYDHLVFVFALVLIPARLRSLLGIVTAFTVAHSLTLAIAALGIWTPSARIIEPAIALSIAYVGLEDLAASGAVKKGPLATWRPDAAKRWRITFPFGLVHGFGFASALKEIGLEGVNIPAALVAFNLGVEAGQLAVLSVLLPVVIALRKTSWFALHGVKTSSALVIVAGLVWFVARVVSSG